MIKTGIGKFIVVSAITIPLVCAALFWYALRSEYKGGCELSTVREQWSSDKAYKATLLRKVCNLNEKISYSIRLDSIGSSSTRVWFVPGFELEDDEYPQDSPEIHWVNKRNLEILIHTRTLSGSLSRNMGDDLIFIRSYVPNEPLALPNY